MLLLLLLLIICTMFFGSVRAAIAMADIFLCLVQFYSTLSAFKSQIELLFSFRAVQKIHQAIFHILVFMIQMS